MNFQDKKVLLYDCGLFVSLAELLVGKFGKVGYFMDWQSGFPDGKNLLIGSGLDGVEREKYFWDVVDDYDLIVFPDCWHGDLQEHLRSQGKRVWGAGKKAGLELNRWGTHETMKRIGLPTNDPEQVHGIENLRAYLQENENVFVKISAYRGLGETFKSINYKLSKEKLDDLRARFGALMDVVSFIVEKEIPDAKEIGYDGYCIDGEFPNSSFIGAEVKNKAYFGKLVDYDELPPEVRNANTKLSYEMDGYRQFFSSELRNQYPIDLTCRHASPAGETFCHAFTNLPEILWYGAEGTLVHAKSSAKYVAQIILSSEWAKEHFMPLEIPDDVRPFAKIFNHCRIEGVDYCVSDNVHAEQVGSVIGLGNTPDEACNAAKERAEKVHGYDLERETDALDKARKTLENTKV